MVHFFFFPPRSSTVTTLRFRLATSPFLLHSTLLHRGKTATFFGTRFRFDPQWMHTSGWNQSFKTFPFTFHENVNHEFLKMGKKLFTRKITIELINKISTRAPFFLTRAGTLNRRSIFLGLISTTYTLRRRRVRKLQEKI